MSSDEIQLRRSVPRWLEWRSFLPFLGLIAVLVIALVGPGAGCSLPALVVWLLVLRSTWISRGGERAAGIVLSLAIGYGALLTTYNLWQLRTATRPIRELGGSFYTAGDGMADIGGPKMVSSISLKKTHLTDEDLLRLRPLLEKFPKLRTLDLSNTFVSDEGMGTLQGLDRLTGLGLLETRVTAEGAKRVQEMFPKCNVLHESTLNRESDK